MLSLPPLYPSTDAHLDVTLAEQIRRLGAAGFPLVHFKGDPLDGHTQREELQRALAASAENGGWPVISMDGPLDAGFLGTEAQRIPGLILGTTLRRIEDCDSSRPPWDHAGVGPFRATGEHSQPIGLAGLQQGSALLRQRGLAPFVFGGLTLMDGESCYQAGAESLAMAREIACSSDPAALLWRAQCLRWKVRPPFQAGQGVALIGGSGCGKSTLARKLGRQLQLPVKDLDESIVQRSGKPIARIFTEDGETVFRRMETEVTIEAFQSEAVLALGGGAWESETIRRIAQASGFAILWIAENPDRIWRRVAQDPTRPLTQERATFLSRWRSRMPRWMEVPMILPLGRTPRQLVNALREQRDS